MRACSVKHFFAMIIVLAVFVSACSDPDVKKVSFLEKGQQLYTQGDYVKARLEFKNAIQMDLKYADAYFMLGKTELKLKSFKKAYGALLKATELAPDNIEAQVELGRLLVVGRAYEKAQERAELILQKDPKNVDGLLIKAKLLVEKGELEDAKQILNNLLAGDNNRVEPYLLLAAVEAKNRRIQVAEEVIGLGLQQFPQEIKLHLMQTELYVKTRRIPEAIDSLNRLIGLEPEKMSYQLTLAGLLWGDGQQQKAEDIFAKLKKDAEKGEENSINIAKFYISKKQFEKAEQDLRAVVDRWPENFTARFVLAELYARTSRTSKGIDLLEGALPLVKDSAHPDSINAKNAIARMYLASGNVVSAEKYVQEVIDDSPNNIDGHFIKGSILLLKNDAAGAISDFRTVISEKPTFIAGHLKLAEAYVLSGQKGLAYDLLGSALDNMPDSKELLRALAKLNAFDKNYGTAEKLLKKIIEKNPNDIQAKAALGDFFVGLKRFRDAEKQYELIKKDSRQHPLSYLRLGRLYVAQGKLSEAFAELKDGFEVAPQSNTLLNALVQVALSQKKFGVAEQACLSRVQKNAEDIYAINILGKVYFAKKDFTKAELQFEKAIKIQPVWPEPHGNLAKLYLVSGQQGEAIAKFKANIDRDPSQMVNYLSLGIIYEQSGEIVKAIDVYEKAIAQNPSFWVAANNLAFLLVENNSPDLDRALDLAESALALRPEGPEVMDTVGWVYYKKGEMDKARTYIKKALEKSPESPILNYHMGVLYKFDGRNELAVESLEKALVDDSVFAGRDNAEKLLAELRDSVKN